MTTVEWVANDGTTLELNVEWGVSNLFAPPAAVDEDKTPGQDGGWLREVRHDVREFVLPIWLYDPNSGQHWTNMRTLVAHMDPRRGLGRIRVSGTPAGGSREISCIATAGLGMDLSDSTPEAQKAPIVFRAFDPYWYGADVVDEFNAGATPAFFPFFPLRMSSSEVFADITVTNDGDVETWPVWEIDGPAIDISLRNLDTGRVVSISTTLLASETIVIDTRPGHKTVIKNGEINLWPDVSLTSSLWPLARGANAVRLEMGGADADVSSVTLRYAPRYLTP